MKYLFDNPDKLKGELSGKYIILFLDYDGTLAPIADTPKKAVISEKTRRLLGGLSKSLRCRVAIISGRGLKDVKKKIGLKGIIYVGNHGLELEGPKIKFVPPIAAGYKNILQGIKKGLVEKTASVKGAFIEDKGLSLAFHFRLVSNKDIPFVKDAFQQAVLMPLEDKKVKIKEGKMVLEVRPALEWDKGKIALWLLARHIFKKDISEVLPVYIGDDLTDEDAFKALARLGLTVFVGKPKPSYARYYLKDTNEVEEFLASILKMQKG